MSWFPRMRALRFLAGAAIYALAWWLAVGAVVSFRPQPPSSDDFTVVSFHADALLQTVDYLGTSLQVVETIVVDFPADSETRRIERVLPTVTRGRQTAVTNVSALMDGGWAPVEMHEGPTQVRAVIGSPSTAPGRHTYRISYIYLNVLSGPRWHQQFVWNVNGPGWSQAIESVSATLTFDRYEEDSDASCRVGPGEGTPPCVVTRTDAFRSATWSSSSVRVGAYQTQTMVISEVVTRRPDPPVAPSSRGWLGLVWLTVGSIAVIVLANLRRAQVQAGKAGEYPRALRFAVRADVAPIEVASLVGYPGRGLVAELLRAAGEGHVTLGGVGNSRSPLTATLVSWPEDWSEESQHALGLLFDSREPGTSVEVRSAINGVPADEVRRLRDLAVDLGLVSASQRSDALRRSSRWLLVATAVLIPAIIVSGRALQLPSWWVVIPCGVLVVALALQWGWILRVRERTPAGHEVMRYLNELKGFLTASKSSRANAVRGSLDTNDPGPEQWVPVFESTLPTAVAMGEEKAWRHAAAESEATLDWLPRGGASAESLGLEDTWAYDTSRRGLSFGDTRPSMRELLSLRGRGRG